MHTIIAYDISGNRARARFHKFLKEFGLNTQKSVFECVLDGEGIKQIVAKARALLNPATDNLRLYPVCAGCRRKVVISGCGLKVVHLDFLIA